MRLFYHYEKYYYHYEKSLLAESCDLMALQLISAGERKLVL